MNPQPKLYHLIDIEGEKKLREVNPYDKRQTIVDDNFLTDYPYNHFEQSAIANAKALVNPVPGKVEYSSDEIKEVWQVSNGNDWYKICNYQNWADSVTRQAFEYIGEKVEENEHLETDMKKASDMYSQGVFSLLNPNNPARNRITESATIDFEAGWESGEQAERSRIIGLIENIGKSQSEVNIEWLLILIKQDGK